MERSSLFHAAVALFQDYNVSKHLHAMRDLQGQAMTEQQFAQFLGKSRLYQYLPKAEQKRLPQMLMTDTQIGMIARAYYNDEQFAVPQNSKEISMWNIYNLLTGANKTSYIDNFLDRSLNALQLTVGLSKALHKESEYTWFLQ